MKLPFASAQYDRANEQAARNEVFKEDYANFKKGQDVRLQRGERLIMPSPNGTLWIVSVSDGGAMVVTAL